MFDNGTQNGPSVRYGLVDDDLPFSLEFVRDAIPNTRDYDLIIGSRYLKKSKVGNCKIDEN